MDFKLQPHEEAFRQEVRAWIKDEFGAGWDGGDMVSPEAGYEYSREVTKKLATKGWLAPAWPKEYGGMGAGYWEQLIFKEEMAYHRVPAGDAVGVGFAGPTIIIYGTEQQKAELLPRILHGEDVWCQGFSEPGSGSDLGSLQTRAVRDGDDYVVNGQKIWTSFAHYADRMILLARTDPDAPKHKGISYFLVDMNTPGITVRPLINMAGGHFFNEVFFDAVRVPSGRLLGQENRGWYQATTTLDFERSSVAGSAGLQRSLDELCAFLRDQGPVEDTVRRALAEIAVEIQIARMLSYHVVSLQARGRIPNHEASIAKLFNSELSQKFARTGFHALGSYGQLQPGSPRVKLGGRYGNNVMTTIPGTIAGGTSEIQRNIIATRGLGLPRG